MQHPHRQGAPAIVEKSSPTDEPAPGGKTSDGSTRAWIPRSHVGSLIAGAAGLLVVALLGVTIHALGNGPLPIDSWWHDLMVSLRTDFGLTVARVMQTVGGTIGVIVTGVVMIVWFAVLRRPWSVVTVVLVMILAQLLTNAAKVIIARPRPADSLGPTAMTSFPSGHTAMAASITIVLALLLSTRLMWIVAAAWIVLMAWSRTYLAAHWLTDVTGGAILGASIALIIWAAIDSLRRAADGTAALISSEEGLARDVSRADEPPSA